MASPNETFRHAVIRLWFSLTTILACAFLFALALILFPGKVLGWLYYLTAGEATYEVWEHAILAAVAAAFLGVICTAAAVPFLWVDSLRDRAARATIRIVSGIAVFLDLFVVVMILGDWAHLNRKQQLGAYTVYLLGFALLLAKSELRRRLTSQFDGLLGERATRRAVLAIGIAVAATVAAGSATAVSVVAGGTAASTRVQPAQGRHPNIILITFDSLSADDMSVYGYGLPTTPRMAEFAAKSSVFTNFYSTSTMTTPSLACVLTGLEPSETGVYQLQGRLRGPRAEQTVERSLREAGYVTAASLTSPMAYFLASRQRDFDFLEGPVYRTHGMTKLWQATQWLLQPQSFGSPLDEFADLEKTWDFAPVLMNRWNRNLFAGKESDFPPDEIFGRARTMVNRLPQGYFLWIHVMAPHWYYLSKAHLGQFLPGDEQTTTKEQDAVSPGGTYSPERQKLVDKSRLRYDEFVADTDSEVGDFLAHLETDGKLADTAVIVTSDHGESFEAGVYQHRHSFQVRPEIHIPLIVRLPGQERAARVAFAADQTSLAPTILEIAGLRPASWMHGPSLVPFLNPNGESAAGKAGRGLAFAEYLETSSTFRHPRSGSAGVTDGVHQYVVDLATGEGTLRNVAEPLLWNFDRSAEDPATVKELRSALFSRFPELFKK